MRLAKEFIGSSNTTDGYASVGGDASTAEPLAGAGGTSGTTTMTFQHFADTVTQFYPSGSAGSALPSPPPTGPATT